MKLVLILATIFVVFIVGSAYGQEEETTTKRPCFHFECRDGTCIPNWLVCDGIAQCNDGSDEEGCPTTTTRRCPAFECRNGNCIPWPWMCDKNDDCGDNSDEDFCPEPTTVPCSEFECPNGACIPYSFLCDGDNDCRDWFDEGPESCPCADNEIRCPQIPENPLPSTCLLSEHICDEEGIWDCPDGWDELNCDRSIVNASGNSRQPVYKMRTGKHSKAVGNNNTNIM